MLAGRPDYGLSEEFLGEGCERIFGDGLPGMLPEDIRAMLLEGLMHGRHQLLRLDDDGLDGGGNFFVDRVVERADGLPLYVHLLLEDLREGDFVLPRTATDPDRLPGDLNAYYRKALEGPGISSVRSHATFVVCVLARVEEPLDDAALGLVLAKAGEVERHSGVGAARLALDLCRALVQPATTRDGTPGTRLYHESLRGYIGGTGEPDGRPARETAPSVERAERVLVELSRAWRELPAGNLRSHILRWGTGYARRWRPQGGLQQSGELFGDPQYLKEMLRAWGEDREAFLDELYGAYTALAAAKRRSFALFVEQPESAATLSPEHIHALLSHRRDESFYFTFLHLTDEKRLVQPLKAPGKRHLLASLKARLANLHRRRGKHDDALTQLKHRILSNG